MGIYDRDYYRSPQPARYGVGRFSWLNITTWLIIINIAIFLGDQFLKPLTIPSRYRDQGFDYLSRAEQRAVIRDSFGPLFELGYFSVSSTFHRLQLWRLLTSLFLHRDLIHLFSNMLGLFVFGPMVERHLGIRRFITFYILCGIAGTLTFVAMFYGGIFVGITEAVPMIGASAAIYGVLVAAAVIAPKTIVRFIFPPIAIQLRTLAIAVLCLAAITSFRNSTNAGGEAAHLGGGVLGFLLMWYPGMLRVFDFNWAWSLLRSPFRRKPKMRIRYTDWTDDFNR